MPKVVYTEEFRRTAVELGRRAGAGVGGCIVHSDRGSQFRA